jgi:signal transduction histidine kinase
LINDLLRFSRQTRVEDEFESVELDTLLSDVVADLDIREDMEKALYIESMPVIWGIQSHMRQLFQNLLSNAFKFRKKETEPSIRVTWTEIEPVERDGVFRRFARIIVEDNGIGFDARFADEIFVVFKRLHSFHEFPGSGVGLAICKKIVDLHDGAIRAESRPGIGSKFSVDLPMSSQKQKDRPFFEQKKSKELDLNKV